jgi:hypothetical protein
MWISDACIKDVCISQYYWKISWVFLLLGERLKIRAWLLVAEIV